MNAREEIIRHNAEKRLWALIDEKIEEHRGNEIVVNALTRLKKEMRDAVLSLKTGR
jgi:hypothetical protein